LARGRSLRDGNGSAGPHLQKRIRIDLIPPAKVVGDVTEGMRGGAVTRRKGGGGGQNRI